MREAGIEFKPELVATAYPDEIGGYAAAKELLVKQAQFTALVGFNDAMVAGAISCFIDNGIAVPAKVSAVGFDDIPYIRFIRPKLTTVSYPIGGYR